MRNCPKCHRDLDEHDFHNCAARQDGLQLWCKTCGSANKHSHYHTDRKMAVRQLSRASALLGKYGLSLTDYDEMLVAQDGVCAICHQPETQRSNPNGCIDSLRVDHDHTTGKVRGLLCSRCNFALGHFLDDAAIVTSALSYLQAASVDVSTFGDPAEKRVDVVKRLNDAMGHKFVAEVNYDTGQTSVSFASAVHHCETCYYVEVSGSDAPCLSCCMKNSLPNWQAR